MTNNESNDQRPNIYPSGQRVTFTSNRDGNEDIYIMNIDGSDLSRLTDDPARDVNPSFFRMEKRFYSIVSDQEIPKSIQRMLMEVKLQ